MFVIKLFRSLFLVVQEIRDSQKRKIPTILFAKFEVKSNKSFHFERICYYQHMIITTQ